MFRGTVLPLSLETGLKAGHIEPAKTIHAKVMQNIPGTEIRRGAHVLGHVVSVGPSQVALRFDTLSIKSERLPITTSLRALASTMEIDFAQIPEDGADRAIPPSDYTTRQVGGDEVYRGGGPVARGSAIVGEPTPYGVLGRLSSNPPCRAAIDRNIRPQALWLFSTDACGLYGFSNLIVAHYGRTDPVGTIVLAVKTGKLNIRSGSGLLLRVGGS